jgi:type IV pilus biogenesis protein CpaD/CtpE
MQFMLRIVTVQVITLAIGGLVGCARSPSQTASVLDTTATVEQAQRETARRYDPTSLLEVTHFADLPEDLKKAVRAGKVPERGPVDERDMGGYRIFVVAGVSKTSALLGYEAGDPPQYGAIAYVKEGSQWVVVNEWDKRADARTLSQLMFITEYLRKRP